jgi:hypothetical protein
MNATKTRTPKQKLADLLRSREYRGCYGQVTQWYDRIGIELFAEDTPEMRARFPLATTSPQGSLYVACVDVDAR